MAKRLSASAVLIVVGAVFPPIGSQRTPPAGNGSIVGVVVNERQEPIARAQVQAFAMDAAAPQPGRVPFAARAAGNAVSDASGRFQITGLKEEEYVVAAETVPSWTSAPPDAAVYGTTFYPSTIDPLAAARVVAAPDDRSPIRIVMVPVKGARISGTVLSSTGDAVAGMEVRLFRQFGSFGAESTLAHLGADGAFQVSRVPPGWYRLTVARPQGPPAGDRGEFATTLIEVRDKDIEGLSLVLRTGASITGRIAGQSGTTVQSTVGFLVSASPSQDSYTAARPITARVAPDGSFRMEGLSGAYHFTARSDRPPFVSAAGITVDGIAASLDGAAFTDGQHEVVIVVAPREVPSTATTLTTAALVDRFNNTKVAFAQFSIAKQIADRHDASVLPALGDWLTHEDRHLRGNAAFIFAALGDPRGFETIVDILKDRSNRPQGQGIATASGDGRYHVERQIAADRYYAAHLLGDLRDPRGVPVLVPLLKDAEVRSIVPWALGEIGDHSAVGPLIDALDDDDPSMRVLSIYALETLKAKEAIPRLMSLLDDHRRSTFGASVTVADAAKAALEKLR